jgi:ABC-type transport system involved in cytochrome c biogenesis permease subunit
VAWFNNDKHLFCIAVILYGLSMIYSVFLWRREFRKDDRVNYVLLATGFVFHSVAMLLRGFSLNRCPITNLYEATIFLMWTIIAIYLAVGLWSRLRFLGAFASPVLTVIGVFALMPGLDVGGGHPRPEVPGALTSAHASLMALAYGAFGLSAVAAIMYLTQERNLKFHKLQAVFSLMPPIQRLEAVSSRLMVAGFVLLSVGLVVGWVGLGHLTNPAIYRGDPKIMWTALVWLLYAGLILMRWRFSQGGRRFALGVIGSFAFILLTFWGSNMLSPLHHP